MTVSLKRTDSDNTDFQALVRDLDKELAVRDGEDYSFYAQFNKLDLIKHVVLAYSGETPAGCGAIKKFTDDAWEVKRMFVPAEMRGQGVAVSVLAELEKWARELGAVRCVLETGLKQPEAVRLYEKSGYRSIPNYGQYVGVENSVCFEKELDT